MDKVEKILSLICEIEKNLAEVKSLIDKNKKDTLALDLDKDSQKLRDADLWDAILLIEKELIAISSLARKESKIKKKFSDRFTKESLTLLISYLSLIISLLIAGIAFSMIL
tara:strand:+ start:18982 stop:19314 length:333 start_codon:yes stop_codon:yes gene_type:complete